MNAAITLWNKHMHQMSSSEAFGLLLQPILWVVLFGVGMRGLLTQTGGDETGLYIAFMAPGIIAVSVQSGAIAGGTVWLDERVRGIVKEYLVAPIPRLSILMGNAMSIVTKSLLQAAIIFIVALLMGMTITVNLLGWIGGLLLIIGYGLGFAGIALATASKTNNSGAYHALIFVLNLPVLFLSNALYPLDALPRWMQIAAQLNPTSYVVDGLRQLVLADATSLAGDMILPVWSCFLVVTLFAALGMWLALKAFRSAIE